MISFGQMMGMRKRDPFEQFFKSVQMPDGSTTFERRLEITPGQSLQQAQAIRQEILSNPQLDGATTLTVLTTPSLRVVRISPAITMREGFTLISSIFTLPALQAAEASVRVLYNRVAQSHLSTRQFSTRPYSFQGLTLLSSS